MNKSQYFLDPICFKSITKVEIDWPHYVTKNNFLRATGVNTKIFSERDDLETIKTKVGELPKLKTFTTNLGKLPKLVLILVKKSKIIEEKKAMK